MSSSRSEAAYLLLDRNSSFGFALFPYPRFHSFHSLTPKITGRRQALCSAQSAGSNLWGLWEAVGIKLAFLDTEHLSVSSFLAFGRATRKRGKDGK